MPTKRYWLRGIIIGLAVIGLAIAESVFLGGEFLATILLYVFVAPIGYVSGLIRNCGGFRCDVTGLADIVTMFIVILVYFIFWALLGWIYGKFKNRKNVVM